MDAKCIEDTLHRGMHPYGVQSHDHCIGRTESYDKTPISLLSSIALTWGGGKIALSHTSSDDAMLLQ